MAFMDSKYLITNETGVRIFASIKDLPVVDPHNHAGRSAYQMASFSVAGESVVGRG